MPKIKIMEEFGFCNLTCIPVRAEASERSEMVNQLIFGEIFEIVDAIKGWKLIRGALDKYEGFIDEKQFLEISAGEFQKLKELPDTFPVQPVSYATDASGNQIMLMPASSMRGFRDGRLSLEKGSITFKERFFTPPENPDRDAIVSAAKTYLQSPYLWGGRTLAGIDCSGLVQNVFKMNGMALHRDASYQAGQGETLNMISEAQPGDLAFFDNQEGEIVHVGIIAHDGKIIHASGHVRIDDIDHHGIYNRQQKKYTHNLRLIKSIV